MNFKEQGLPMLKPSKTRRSKRALPGGKRQPARQFLGIRVFLTGL